MDRTGSALLASDGSHSILSRQREQGGDEGAGTAYPGPAAVFLAPASPGGAER